MEQSLHGIGELHPAVLAPSAVLLLARVRSAAQSPRDLGDARVVAVMPLQIGGVVEELAADLTSRVVDLLLGRDAFSPRFVTFFVAVEKEVFAAVRAFEVGRGRPLLAEVLLVSCEVVSVPEGLLAEGAFGKLEFNFLHPRRS